MEKIPSDILLQLGAVMAEALTDGDSVALPGFGTFGTKKCDEHVESVDDVTYLFPPRLEVVFTPAIKFTKALKEKGVDHE